MGHQIPSCKAHDPKDAVSSYRRYRIPSLPLVAASSYSMGLVSCRHRKVSPTLASQAGMKGPGDIRKESQVSETLVMTQY